MWLRICLVREALKYHLKTHSGDGENGDDYDDGEDYDDIHDYDDFPENIRQAVKQNLRQKLDQLAGPRWSTPN